MKNGYLHYKQHKEDAEIIQSFLEIKGFLYQYTDGFLFCTNRVCIMQIFQIVDMAFCLLDTNKNLRVLIMVQNVN